MKRQNRRRHDAKACEIDRVQSDRGQAYGAAVVNWTCGCSCLGVRTLVAPDGSPKGFAHAKANSDSNADDQNDDQDFNHDSCPSVKSVHKGTGAVLLARLGSLLQFALVGPDLAVLLSSEDDAGSWLVQRAVGDHGFDICLERVAVVGLGSGAAGCPLEGGYFH